MSFLAGLGFTSEKPPIVIEFGTRYTKAGFGGEAGPRVIVATPAQVRASDCSGREFFCFTNESFYQHRGLNSGFLCAFCILFLAVLVS